MAPENGPEPQPTAGQVEPSAGDLTERELDVLRWVATGASNKEIARRLAISPNTVKVHLRNILTKTGTGSRTEATVFAIRRGLAPGVAGAGGEAAAPAVPAPAPAPERWRRWAPGLMVIAVLAALGLARMWPAQVASTPAPPPAATLVGWQSRAGLPVPRSNLAVASYQNLIYAVGGETAEGVTGQMDRYDPLKDNWESLAAKPSPVADAGGAFIGGRLYVPGGRLAGGEPTDVLEVYEPRRDRWEQRAPLPVPLSGSAVSEFEGRLYVIGGWDGAEVVDQVYVYDPALDHWAPLPPIPTARAFAGSAVAAGKIYVIGGSDGHSPVTVNEAFTPDEEAGALAWQAAAPLPAGRAHMGIVSVADIIHLVGGEGEGVDLPPLEYFPQTDSWQPFDAPVAGAWPDLGVSLVGAELHIFGGRPGGELTAQHLSYQAIYILVLPILPLNP